MQCRLTDLRRKEIINVKDGARLGAVSDMEVDSVSARLTALVVGGKPRFFGFFGREDDTVIPWQDIRIIGEDTILVDYRQPYKPKHRKNIFSVFFGEG